MNRIVRGVVCVVALAAIAPVASSSPASAPQAGAASLDGYSEGWADGWKEGWKYVKGPYSYPPYPPYAPYPRPGQNTYKDGYNRGFMAGAAAAQSR